MPLTSVDYFAIFAHFDVVGLPSKPSSKLVSTLIYPSFKGALVPRGQ